MLRRWKMTILCIITMMAINVIPTYADEIFYWNGIEIEEYDDESIILPESVKESRGVEYGQPRGTVISSAMVSISDEYYGNIGLNIQTHAHVACDKIRHSVTLQEWNETGDDWDVVARFEYEALQEDNPDEKLVGLSNGLVVKDLPAGIYRARGLHAVYLGDVYEGFSTKTNGIQISR